jgi:ribonucleotide monophosphatase NagD (HAD superfamily)
VVTGKPEAPMRAIIERRATGGILMVGDRPETDIALAGSDWWSALVLTGVTRTSPGASDPYPASIVLDSIVSLPAALGLASAE